ncbi:MAG: ABC transporter permease subunit [Anaerolineae bacterium]
MKESATDKKGLASRPPEIRLALILVAITAVLSVLYGIQYYLGGPIRLSVVSPFDDLALSPDGSVIAAGADDGTVHVWEVPPDFTTGLPADFNVAEQPAWTERTLRGHDKPVLAVASTADGSTLISVSSDGELFRWSLADVLAGAGPSAAGTSLALNGGPFTVAAADATGSLLALVGEDGVVQVVDTASGQPVQSLDAQSSGYAVALNDDGTLVASAQDTVIGIWDVQSGELVQSIEGYWEDEEQDTWLGHEEPVTALAFGPNDQLLASGSADTTIVFWDIETGEAETLSEGHWATVTTMVFSQDGNFLLSGGKDNKVREIRVAGGKSAASYEGHLSAVSSTAYGPVEDAILSTGDDGTMRVWETTNQRMVHLEWSRFGLQPTWGTVLAAWMLISGVLGLVCVWGLLGDRVWSHLFATGLFLFGPIVVLGLPLFEVLSYPLVFSRKLQIAWPLMVLVVWYIVLLWALLREQVAVAYEAPRDVSLSEQITISQRTVRTRFGIFNLAVWIALLVILYSVLRRFNLDIAFMGHFFGFIMAGAGLTVLVSAASIALAVVLALLGALGRLSKNPIPNGIAGFYVSLIRGTPLLVQIFIWYLGLPQLGVILRPIAAGILALGVNYGAYMTEIFRAGIQAISKGQREAAEALGMSGAQTFRRIILPQAFRIVIPPIGNDFIAMMKDSSLVYLMGVWELTFRAQKIGRQNFRTMETFIIAAGFYWLLTVIFQFLQGKLEEYMARGERR